MRCLGGVRGVLVVLLALFSLVSSIFLFVVYPIIYDTIVRNMLVLSKDGETLGYAANLFAHPPLINHMQFYFFNVTNQDEIAYRGAMPRLKEIGPYTFTEVEEKRYVQFNGDETQLFYQNYKTYYFDEDNSCDTCRYDDPVTIPNPTEIGGAADILNPKFGLTPLTQLFVSAGLLLLGEYPFVTVPVGSLLFSGYSDALLSVAHSPLVDLLNTIFNRTVIPIPVPAMERMAFFQGYNNSRDEEYWVRTGKEDVQHLGEIVTWANVSLLPDTWWTTEDARRINGTDTGSFSKWHLTKEDVLPMFHSFLCRSFNAVYEQDVTVERIPSMRFSVPADQFDTTLDVNRGFRYANPENIKYFSGWPKCPNVTSVCDRNMTMPDCSLHEHICDGCCRTEGVPLLPPGMFPLVCYPGKMEESPFAIIMSPPHFLFSPPEVVTSVVGLDPQFAIHNPLVFDREPTSGMVTQVFYRIQVSMPMFSNPMVSQNYHLPSSVVPILWESAHATMKPFVYSLYYTGFVLVPLIIRIVRVVLLAVAVLLIVGFLFLRLRK